MKKQKKLIIKGHSAKEELFYSIEADKDNAISIPGAELLIFDGMEISFARKNIHRIANAIVANSNKNGPKQIPEPVYINT